MSSAILFLAILAIWAGVLIPRWLRRDSARGTSSAGYQADSDEQGTDADEQGTDVGYTAGADSAADGDLTRVPFDDSDHTANAHDAPRRAAAPLSSAESRRRMLAGRRRMLGMLIVLEFAAIALTVLKLAAIWVVIPPSLMLAGYLMLLREAAHADAERAQREADATAAAQARERARTAAADHAPAEGGPAVQETAAIATTATTAAEFAARFAAAPVPADYEDPGPGRDFAPGLAGKYTTSYADEDGRDGHEPPRLRAVGD